MTITFLSFYLLVEKRTWVLVLSGTMRIRVNEPQLLVGNYEELWLTPTFINYENTIFNL
jgi:hypothetical protein